MATFSYFYTVSAITDYQEYFRGAQAGTLLQDDWKHFDDLTSHVHDEVRPTGGTSPVNGVYTGPATEVAPYATTIKVKKNMKVIYYIRFYMKEVDGGTTKYYWLNDNALKNVKIKAASSKYSLDTGVKTVKKGYDGFIASKYPNVLGVTSGNCFVFTMYVKEANFKLDNPFTVTAEFTPSSFGYGGTTPNPSSTVVNITTAMIGGMNPSINCTQAAVNPTPNTNFLNALKDQSQSSGYYTYPDGSAGQGTEKDLTNFQYVYAYDSCTKDTSKVWVGVKWGRTVSADRKKILVKYTVIYGSKDGQNFDASKFKPLTDPVTTGKTYITSPKLEKVLDTIIKLRMSNCGAAGSSSSGSNGDNGSPDTVMIRPVPPADSLRWNPPPHVEARTVNFAYRVNAADTLIDSNGNIVTDTTFNNALGEFYGVKPERGRIFQDKITAKVMNTTKLSVVSKKADVLQWGYQFMYNPESISYQTSDGSGIDWTYGSKDKAVVLSGSQTISFDLLINRIPDMSYLKNKLGAATMLNNEINVMSSQQAYGRDLEPYEVQGILKRGTEYDIEYLYRVLTGDPMTNSLLLEPGYAKTALTSDIGYITKVPVWLYLHDNMRLFGSVASISVMHRIFDQNMVPMLSRMSVSFTRYPAYEGKAPNTKSTATSTGN